MKSGIFADSLNCKARGRKLETEARTRQLTSFSRQGRGRRAKDKARHKVEISRLRQGGS